MFIVAKINIFLYKQLEMNSEIPRVRFFCFIKNLLIRSIVLTFFTIVCFTINIPIVGTLVEDRLHISCFYLCQILHIVNSSVTN